MMTACTESLPWIDTDGEIEVGEPVMFTTLAPNARRTRTPKEEWKTEVDFYKAINQNYTLHVEMFKEGDAEHPVGSATYKPAQFSDRFDVTTQNGTLGAISHDGTLALEAKEGNPPLYWQDNFNQWAFKATAGTATLEADQSNQTAWLAQDKMVGYGYLPIWIDANYHDGYQGEYDLNALNFRTSKEWYRDNKTAKDDSGLMIAPGSKGEEYKKIPLYMQHQRAWVTVILRAGEGVTRQALDFSTAEENISTTIYSYGDPHLEIHKAWASAATIDYVADANGPEAHGVGTTRYDAIIDPYDFATHKETKIASISLSGQKFSFSADCDLRGSDDTKQAYREWQDAFNLTAGKHLIIEATLSRESRKILITAWVVDWSEIVNQTICDDYGQNGDPILITSTEELKDFFANEDKNKAGNVGLIVPNALILNENNNSWNGSGYTLKATLNLAGAKLQSDHQLVKSIDRTGSIVNGEIYVTDDFNDKSAITDINDGTIERIKVTTSSETSPARASVAGVVSSNHGIVYQCTSSLPVYGNLATTGTYYVGGIAGESVYGENSDVIPVIEACTVTARVDGDGNVTAGGGIAGIVEGKLSNNTFEYGITLLQPDTRFKNIIAAVGDHHGGLTVHSDNAWPTTSRYNVTGALEIINRNTTDNYDAVIDRELELKTLLNATYNVAGRKYRVANSFSVNKESWIWGTSILSDTYFKSTGGDYDYGRVKFSLNGHDKTITLTATGDNATMLFGEIIGEVHDLNIYLAKKIVADRIMSTKNKDDDPDVDTNTDAISAFAYAVTSGGDHVGTISNINLKAAKDVYIQASTAAGLVVWAMYGGKIINCASNVPVKMNLSNVESEARRYVGGIVACAQIATITQCKYYADKGIDWVGSGNPEQISPCQKNNCRYGGIVGGTTEISGDQIALHQPNVVLTDCYSWWTLPSFDENVSPANRPFMGSLIGSTVYHDSNNIYNAMADGNAGNWWIGTTGAGTTAAGVTVEMAIGKKNSLNPSKPAGW